MNRLGTRIGIQNVTGSLKVNNSAPSIQPAKRNISSRDDGDVVVCFKAPHSHIGLRLQINRTRYACPQTVDNLQRIRRVHRNIALITDHHGIRDDGSNLNGLQQNITASIGRNPSGPHRPSIDHEISS